MFFHRHPLEKAWTKLEKYERALGSISSIKPRLAKRITGALRNSLQEELDRHKSRGTCSAYGLIDVIYGFDDAISYIQFLVQSPGLYTRQQLRACQKAVFAARDLSQAVENLARDVAQSSSDPRNKYLLPRIETTKWQRLLVAL